VELHAHIEEGGMVKMRRVQRIELAAGEEVALKPGGFHVMLIGLKRRLTPGEEVAFTLEFADGSRKELRASVRKINVM
jgi:copper(I)-binding protein